jgi:hypothetical protein
MGMGMGMAEQRTALPGEINHGFVDLWSVVHGLVGVGAVVLGLGFWPTLAIAVSWEFVEHLLKDLIPAMFPHATQDTLTNAVGDVLSTMLGWFIARVYRMRDPERVPHPPR